MTANDIADLIETLAASAARGADWTDADIKRHSHLNRVLWDEARARGLASQVDDILQGRAVAEVVAALDRL